MGLPRVYPLHVGTITRRIGSFCRGLGPGTADLPLISWYIDGLDEKIVVDTGGGDPSEMPKEIQPYTREKDQVIETALLRLGVRPEDIDIVVVTHLHWDHSGGNHLFPNARVIVQQEELRTACPFAPGIPGRHYCLDRVQYTLVSGDTQIAENVYALLTPGHTFGLQAVLVQGETQKMLIASDTFPLFKNLQSLPATISDTYVDLDQYLATVKRIQELQAFVLPSHDFEVLEREVYS
jgi:N-acyl homoserine lactone hydrolase